MLLLMLQNSLIPKYRNLETQPLVSNAVIFKDKDSIWSRWNWASLMFLTPRNRCSMLAGKCLINVPHTSQPLLNVSR
jgi:hypothetical protein